MDELAKAVRHFITRDLIFILGGSTVIVSMLHLFGRLDLATLPTPYMLLSTGLAYVIGYLIQDLVSLTPVITVNYPIQYNRFIRWLYRQFEREPWQDIPQFDVLATRLLIYERAPEIEVAYFERLISLKQIGTVMGPCAFISAVPLALKALQTRDAFEVTLSILTPIAGTVLILLAWIKTAQATRYMHNLHIRLNAQLNVDHVEDNRQVTDLRTDSEIAGEKE